MKNRTHHRKKKPRNKQPPVQVPKYFEHTEMNITEFAHEKAYDVRKCSPYHLKLIPRVHIVGIYPVDIYMSTRSRAVSVIVAKAHIHGTARSIRELAAIIPNARILI